ncbi:MAG: hypothetical protein V2A73_08555 [Pseudomonadota bacterium]
MPNDRPLETCEICGAQVTELRRNRCWGCYSRWAESRPVGIGAVCAICGERRRSNLRLVEFRRSWLPMCHICATRATELIPMPESLEEMRWRLQRERRQDDRRIGRQDDRVFRWERRGLERRNVGHLQNADLLVVDDEDILVVEDASGEDETRIVSQPPDERACSA